LGVQGSREELKDIDQHIEDRGDHGRMIPPERGGPARTMARHAAARRLGPFRTDAVFPDHRWGHGRGQDD
jgi:hypothetical protein